jgi:pimeloyl-ACP methyl ester carboxylesterase
MATIKRILSPIIHKNGDVEYQTYFSPPDDSIAICYKVANRIIPVVFVPGVMGSNLTTAETRWLLDDEGSAAKWITKDPADRKRLLDPLKTRVYAGGKLPEGAEPGIIFTGATQQDKDDELKRRGWGEVAGLSYGAWLKWLEEELNRLEYCYTGVPDGKHRHQVAIPPGVPPLTPQEGTLAYRYQFPVHAVGYNWLQSNAKSAEHLQKRVNDIIGHYKNKGHPCEKVILITHSMGGLVARHYTEVLGGAAKVYGVVHGVMPDLGAATAYKRVKAGTEGGDVKANSVKDAVVGHVKSKVVSRVLGDTAAKMTAVFAQSPGPLQLLPSARYGDGWLTIKDGQQLTRLPQGGDPYGEIYTVRGKWWGLIDDKLINPLDVKKQTLDKDWDAFENLINKRVYPFHQEIAGQYHSHTYAFYGDDAAHKTWGNVVWERKTSGLIPSSQPNGSAPAGTHSAIKSFRIDQAISPLSNARDIAKNFDNGQGQIDVLNQKPFEYASFHIKDASENGDGTVPVRSGSAPLLCAPRGRIKVCIGYPNVGHENAYEHEPQRWFTVWAITKILQNVRGTAMDYPDPPATATVATTETTA